MDKRIEQLTPAQEALIPEYIERFFQIGVSTEPTNKARAEEALKAAYRYLKYEEPEIEWYDNVFDGVKAAAKLANNTDSPTPAQISEQAEKASFGSFEAYWVAFYTFIAENLPVTRDELIDICNVITQECGVYWTFEGKVIATEKPTGVKYDSQRRLHNPDGFAIEYKNGTGIYAINGNTYGSLLEAKLQEKLGNK